MLDFYCVIYIKEFMMKTLTKDEKKLVHWIYNQVSQNPLDELKHFKLCIHGVLVHFKKGKFDVQEI